MKRIYLFILSFVIAVNTLFGQESDIGFFSVRSAAIGNLLIANPGIKENYLFNPALLAAREKKSLTFIFDGSYFLDPKAIDFFRFMGNNHYNLVRNFQTSLNDPIYNSEFNSLEKRHFFRGITNTTFAIIKRNFAFSILSFYRQRYQPDKQSDKAFIQFDDDLTILTVISYSKKIPFYDGNSNLSIGFSLKNYFIKTNYGNVIQNEETLNQYYSSFSYDKFFSENSNFFSKGTWYTGYSLDIGLLYELRKYHTNIGAVFKNFIESKEVHKENFFAQVGVGYYPPIFQNRKFIKHFLINVNGVNIGKSSSNALDYITIGSEIRVPLIDLRAGLFHKKLTYGFGVNLGNIHFDFAYGYYHIFGEYNSQLYLFGIKVGE